MSVLLLCHGNPCRPPVAERLAASWARAALRTGPDAAGMSISSAGLGARDGEPMDPMSAEALQELGGSAEGFRSRRFVPALAEGAGLVLTMTERQRRSVLEVTPLGLRRTFTLPEAAALLPLTEVADLAALPLNQRLSELGRRLHEARGRRPRPSWSDITDPLGRRSSTHRDTAQQIAAALRPLADVLFPTSSSGPPVPPAEAPRSALRGANQN